MAKFSDEQVAAALRGTRAFSVYPMPGHPEIQVAVRLLSDQEIDDARRAGQVSIREWARARSYDPTTVVDIDPEAFTRATQREMIFAAFYDAATVGSAKPERFFLTPQEISSLGSNDVNALFELYSQHQQSVSPMRTAEAEEVEELERALGKGPLVPAHLGGFDRSTLIRLLLSTAKRLSTSPTSR